MLPLVFGRRHRSGYRFGRWFGPSWSATVGMRVVVEEPGVTLLAEDGVMLTYPHPEVGTPVVPDSGQRWPLSRTDTGGYRVHDPDRGLTWHFTPKAELEGLDSVLGNIAISAITDRHRNRILFRYDTSGTPVEVSHSGGYRVLVDTRSGAGFPGVAKRFTVQIFRRRRAAIAERSHTSAHILASFTRNSEVVNLSETGRG
ncbi:hypothetical protein FND50_00885 [Rhodococcus sp. WB9]|nr:hypothetical protein FND50_00885 [Rhodococcus sp. WB9]